jgi:hypothetical protein
MKQQLAKNKNLSLAKEVGINSPKETSDTVNYTHNKTKQVGM